MGGHIPENWICAMKWKEAWGWGGNPNKARELSIFKKGSVLNAGRQRSTIFEILTGMKGKREIKGERGVWPRAEDQPESTSGESLLKEGRLLTRALLTSRILWHLFTRPHPCRMPRPRYYSSYSVTSKTQPFTQHMFWYLHQNCRFGPWPGSSVGWSISLIHQDGSSIPAQGSYKKVMRAWISGTTKQCLPLSPSLPSSFALYKNQ